MDKRLSSAHRIAASFVRRHVGSGLATVAFDSGRSKIVADLSTPLGLGLYRYPGYWDSDLDVLDELRAGDVFVDCGANIGLFTLVAADRVSDPGLVIAFEPAPSTRVALLRNIARSGHRNVTVLPHALSDAPGEVPFVVMGDSGGLSSFAPAAPLLGYQLQVPVTTLDIGIPAEAWGRIRLIKVDIEGAEVQALRGATRVLTEERPLLLIEVEDSHLRRQGSSAAELFALLTGAGYVGVPTPGPGPNYLFRPEDR